MVSSDIQVAGLWWQSIVQPVKQRGSFVIIYNSGVALLTPFLQIFDILMALGGRI